MLDKLLRKFIAHRIIQVDDGDYIIRWFLLGSHGEGDNRRGLRIHKILKSDNLRALHDHPYRFASIIIWNGYIEHRPGGNTRRYWPGMVNYKGLQDFHALELKRPAWTIVITGKRRQDRNDETADWGFDVPDVGWVSWKDYKTEGII